MWQQTNTYRHIFLPQNMERQDTGPVSCNKMTTFTLGFINAYWLSKVNKINFMNICLVPVFRNNILISSFSSCKISKYSSHFYITLICILYQDQVVFVEKSFTIFWFISSTVLIIEPEEENVEEWQNQTLRLW